MSTNKIIAGDVVESGAGKRGRVSQYPRSAITRGSEVVGVYVGGIDRAVYFVDLFGSELGDPRLQNAVKFALDRHLGASLGSVEKAVESGMFATTDQAASYFIEESVKSAKLGNFGSVSGEAPGQGDLDLITAIARRFLNNDEKESASRYWAKAAQGSEAFKSWVSKVKTDAGITAILSTLKAERAIAAAAGAATDQSVEDLFA